MAAFIKLLPPLTPEQLSENQQSSIVAGNITVAVLATIAVALRFYARMTQTKSFGADDFVILAALPFGWGMCAATIIATNNGLGRHLLAVLEADTTGAMLVREGQAYFSTELLWTVAVFLVKTSILLLYIRLFGRLRWMRIGAYTLGAYTTAWAIMVIVVCFTQCQPLALIWDKSLEGTCIDSWLFFVIGSSLNTFGDLVILVLPLPAVWGLQLGKFQRFSLIGIFLLGSLTCVFSLIRLAEVIEDNNNLDITWALGNVSIWSTAEPCLGIVTTSLPTLRPLFSRFTKSLTAVGKSSGSAGYGYSSSKKQQYGMSSDFSQAQSRNRDSDNIELRDPHGRGFREIRDDLPIMRPGEPQPHSIEVRTTWETKHEPYRQSQV